MLTVRTAGEELNVLLSSLLLFIHKNSDLRLMPQHKRLECIAQYEPMKPFLHYSFAAWASLAAVNLSATVSHRSIRSSKPFSNASYAVVPSAPGSACTNEYGELHIGYSLCC